jgi:hypothetical protein
MIENIENVKAGIPPTAVGGLFKSSLHRVTTYLTHPIIIAAGAIISRQEGVT